MDNIISKEQRVRKNTSLSTNLKIDEKILGNITFYSTQSDAEINKRIKELENEWDIERVLGLKMSALALTGIGLTVFSDRKWLALPALAIGFFAQHSLQGWCPPVKLLRALQIRTRDEINQEKNALKALRGDYKHVESADEAFIAAKRD